MLTVRLNSRVVYGIILFLIPAYTWAKFFKRWIRLHAAHNSRKLFRDRHNCVVMYRGNYLPTGWPGYEATSPKKTISNADPLVYFIRTANKTIDVAVMIINVSSLVEQLIAAHKRGVRVRMLLDFQYSQRSLATMLKQAGIECTFFVSPKEEYCSIMHFKYMVKDYVEGYSGYAFIGSTNWTPTAFLSNYENLVFTDNAKIVQALNENFESSSKYVQDLNRSNSYVKAKLTGV